MLYWRDYVKSGGAIARFHYMNTESHRDTDTGKKTEGLTDKFKYEQMVDLTEKSKNDPDREKENTESRQRSTKDNNSSKTDSKDSD